MEKTVVFQATICKSESSNEVMDIKRMRLCPVVFLIPYQLWCGHFFFFLSWKKSLTMKTGSSQALLDLNLGSSTTQILRIDIRFAEGRLPCFFFREKKPRLQEFVPKKTFFGNSPPLRWYVSIAGSKYWFPPGLGGLVQGQIHNPVTLQSRHKVTSY